MWCWQVQGWSRVETLQQPPFRRNTPRRRGGVAELNTSYWLVPCPPPCQAFPPCKIIFINPSPPTAAYMRRRTGSALVQITACRLFGAKPSSKPILGDCQLNYWKQTSMKFKYFIHGNASGNIVCEMAAIYPGGAELTLTRYSHFKRSHLLMDDTTWIFIETAWEI